MPARVECFGAAAQFPPDELPTVRDVILHAKYLQETLPGKSLGLTDLKIGELKIINAIIFLFSLKLSVEPIVTGVLGKWFLSSEFFSPPRLITFGAIKMKVTRILTMASKYEKQGGTKEAREKYVSESDSLLNILACKCQLQSCTLFHCEKTGGFPAPQCGVSEFHYDCSCGPDKTIPSHLLKFVW